MTAILAVKYKDGVVIHSDSLALNLYTYEDDDIIVNFIDNIGKHRQKVFRISLYGVICFSGSNFPLDIMKPIANALSDTIKDRQLRKLTDIAENAKTIIKRELKKGQEIQALIAGYELDEDGLPSACSMLHIDGAYKVKEITENYFALGVGQLISFKFKRANWTVPLFNNVEAADKQADVLMSYLSEQEMLMQEAGDNDWHIGGMVRRISISKAGVKNLPTVRKLPTRVAMWQVYSMEVKDR